MTRAPSPLLSARGVSKVFTVDNQPQIVALDDVSLTIAPGRIAVLLGPSGSGKSTLLNIFAGLDRATEGTVEYGDAAKARGEVGMMFQRASLLPWRTTLENILLPAELLGLDRREAEQRARDLLAMVHLDAKWADRYPWELSGGMQQRVALARVLLPDPHVLLLDEPFGALDEMTRESLDLEMCRIVERTGKTVVMVTHSVYEAVLVADDIFVLSAHPGRLVGVIDVPLGRPRTLDASGTELFAEKVAEVRRYLQHPEPGSAP